MMHNTFVIWDIIEVRATKIQFHPIMKLKDNYTSHNIIHLNLLISDFGLIHGACLFNNTLKTFGGIEEKVKIRNGGHLDLVFS